MRVLRPPVALGPAGERLLRRDGALPDRRRRREGVRDQGRRAARTPLKLPLPIAAGRLRRGARGARPARAQPDRLRRPLRRRRASRSPGRSRHGGLRGRGRQGDVRAGRHRQLVLQSPFQKARALAVVEAPEGNRYRWVAVEGGAATFQVPIRPDLRAPRAGALRAHARPGPGHGPGAGQRHRPRQAGDHGGDHVVEVNPVERTASRSSSSIPRGRCRARRSR